MEECCSQNEKCGCDCHAKHHEEEDDHGNFKDFLLEIADEAWCEVLKDKIKEHILATQESRMEELAKIVSETNSNRWKSKMESKRNKKDFKEKLSSFFGHSKQ